MIIYVNIYAYFILGQSRHRLDLIPFLCVIITYASMKTYTSPMTSMAQRDTINGSMNRTVSSIYTKCGLMQDVWKGRKGRMLSIDHAASKQPRSIWESAWFMVIIMRTVKHCWLGISWDSEIGYHNIHWEVDVIGKWFHWRISIGGFLGRFTAWQSLKTKVPIFAAFSFFPPCHRLLKSEL